MPRRPPRLACISRGPPVVAPPIGPHPPHRDAVLSAPPPGRPPPQGPPPAAPGLRWASCGEEAAMSDTTNWSSDPFEELRVQAGFRLTEQSTDATPGFDGDKKAAEEALR